MHATLDLTADPTGAGFDPARLARIDEHLRTRYVEAGKIAGCQVVVARGDRVAHHATIGFADREREAPVRPDTIWRIFSMTKPITGVALLSLYEQGKVALKDPVERFLPEFRGVQVRQRDAEGEVHLADPARPMTVRDLLMHTSGIGYGPRGARLDLATLGDKPPSARLPRRRHAADARRAARPEPLRFHPGTRWLYSWSTDVAARAGRGRVGAAVRRVPAGDDLRPARHGRHRLRGVRCRDRPLRCALPRGTRPRSWSCPTTRSTSAYRTQPAFLSGGGGLVSTAADYLRFCRMLAGGGAVDGVRGAGAADGRADAR